MNNEKKTLSELEEKSKPSGSIIDQFKPYPIAEVKRAITELRFSDKFIDIKKSSRAPKGEFCDNCENLTTKYEPRICSWNDEVTSVVHFSYCSFFNVNLDEVENGCCNTRCKKCLACLLQTAQKTER